MHKICSIYCNDKEEHKDLSQEILIQLWKAFPTFRGESKFSSWMYRVALNVAIQHLRKAKRRPEEVKLPPYLEIAEPDDIDNYEERMQLLRSAIAELNDVEKAIIMLHLEKRESEEIAQIMGITANYVRVKVNRIKKKLSKTINPRGHGV